MADRFYCPKPPDSGRLTLEEDEARHLTRVLRLGPGALVEVFDGKGWAVAARVVAVGRDRVELEPAGDPIPDRVAARQITLATAVPKGDRFDWLVEKATEIGVARLVPLTTERSVVDPRGAKLERLRRRVVEASKQCGRNTLMGLVEPVSWNRFLREDGGALRLIAHPDGLPAGDWPRPEVGRTAVVAIGPEGGFTEPEVEAARAEGWRAIRLGPTLLRIETAAVAACSALLALCEASVE